MRSLLPWMVLSALAGACTSFGAATTLENDSGAPDGATLPEPDPEAGVADGAVDATTTDATVMPDVADPADGFFKTDSSGTDAGFGDPDGGMLVAQDFEGAGTNCPGVMSDGTTVLVRTIEGDGRGGGKACKVCKKTGAQFFGPRSQNFPALTGNYRVTLWIRNDPSGIGAPQVRPAVSINGSQMVGAAHTPNAVWQQMTHVYPVTSGQMVAWALNSDNLAEPLCYLIDDLVFEKE